MFDSPYELTLRTRRSRGPNDWFTAVSVYTFRTLTGVPYILEIEEYHNGFYAIKFFCKQHRNTKHKFTALTNEGHPSRILATAFDAILNTYDKNPGASFGVVGMATAGSDDRRRLAIYSGILADKVSPVNFEHLVWEEKRTYLLLNRDTMEQMGKDDADWDPAIGLRTGRQKLIDYAREMTNRLVV